MDDYHMQYLPTTVAKCNGLEVLVLVLMLMEGSTEITTSVEQPVLTT